MSTQDTELRSSEGRVGPVDDRPLTEQEYRLLQRLLSDPFSFPIAFKTWLVSYLNGSDLDIPMSAVHGLTGLLGVATAGDGVLGLFPAGIILPTGSDTAPVGAKMCDGTGYNKVTEQRLFDAIGFKFGQVDANTFRVPDMQERIPVGKGLLAALNAVGKSDGLSVGSRGILHRHAASATAVVNDPGHAHPYDVQNFSGGGSHTLRSDTGIVGTQSPPGAIKTAYTGISVTINATVGPNGTPVDGPAYLVLNFIIIA